MVNFRKTTASILIFCMIITAMATVYSANLGAISGHWAERHIRFLVDKGIMGGDDSGDLRLENTVTRGEFVAMLVRGLYQGTAIPPGNNGFADVKKSDWYYDIFSFAKNEGIVKGDGKNVYPKSDITREEIVLMITRSLKLAGGSSNFVDVGKNYKYYKEISACVETGIITGFEDNTFRPTDNARRSEAGVMIARMLQHKGEVIPPLPSATPTPTPVPPVNNNGSKINLTWHQIYNKSVNKTGTHMDGINVISPTWFKVITEKDIDKNAANVTPLGDTGLYMSSYLNEEYIADAKMEGYQIWPIFKTDFTLDTTRKFLYSDKARWTAMGYLEDVCKKYGLSGINIDFENMYIDDKDYFSYFLKEMSEVTQRSGLTLSVDVTKYHPYGGTWSLCYDRATIGKYADYVILMAYDENGTFSKTAGSVSTMPWVEEGIKTLTAEVPASKVVLAIPYYARLWKESEGKVTSVALGMEDVMKKINEAGATISFDNKSGQNYSQWNSGSDVYKVWIEDKTSIKNRVDLMKKYGLAGVAGWSKRFMDNNNWSYLNQLLQ